MLANHLVHRTPKIQVDVNLAPPSLELLLRRLPAMFWVCTKQLYVSGMMLLRL